MEPKLTTSLQDAESRLLNKFVKKTEVQAPIMPAKEPAVEKKVETVAVVETPAPSKPEVKPSEEEKNTLEAKATKTPEAVKAPEVSFGAQTAAAIELATEIIPKDLVPTEEFLLKAIESLQGLDQLGETARASAIIKMAQSLQAQEKESNASKEALKEQVQMPGSGNRTVSERPLAQRMRSRDPREAKMAMKEAMFNSVKLAMSPQTKQEWGIKD